MSEKEEQKKSTWLSGLSEDWVAVIIGLGLVALVWIGVIADVPWPLFGFFE